MPQPTADLTRLIRCACILEATARKPGNVHPEAAFSDLCYDDFVKAARVASPLLAESQQRGVGRAILDAVRATGETTASNVNLGIILLLAPLASVPANLSLADGISGVLDNLTQQDASLAYQAIRLASPGGMGRNETEDVSAEPTGTLLEVMRLAADRDAIAMQYASRFELVLKTGVSILAAESDFRENWEQAIIRLQLTLMATCPDSLIARKLGVDEARQSAELAEAVLAAGWPSTRRAAQKLIELDVWLRDRENSRNPGTTADLVAASIFAALRDGLVEMPPGME
ncbi:MAG: triphosphoribosyl-dephospho-CoA synthetase [Planctomycetaceae bacterium]|jgi:triphosphoribosyl-dephospho-CoA synthase|nr:triphosphoribosyl-dephospho-CoA synthetase [Planctomycetaceae bacterium]MBT6158291.1 triphosphoribosyl-dephospho-CoA synthetase [Planctomycetaceae bacterium]MBT6487366.1 triphosphoribosyl-dephospho-CoA synthetase [Planctomycetaceae bacterium]MBT6494422.1 triphosphoribosyl-dephospho-CoA synthetase [Planctomycetaceae bacterium]